MQTPPRYTPGRLLSTLSLILLAMGHTCLGGRFVAYSLKEAKRQLDAPESSSSERQHLGGMTLPLGGVYDPRNQDVILVGEVIEGRATVSLDDLAVALRASLRYHAPPLVSIDRTPDTDRTGKQCVRFEGGIENTEFGSDLLASDVVLKKMGLGQLATSSWGFRSYFDLKADEWRTTGNANAVCSRFWFKPSKQRSYVAVQDGVAIVNRLVVDVETEITSGVSPTGSAQRSSGFGDDPIGQRFAVAMTSAFEVLTTSFPVLARLDTLFRLSGLAEALGRWRDQHHWPTASIDFWLNDYAVKVKPTERSYPLLESRAERPGGGTMQVDGGVALQALILDIRDGSITAFRDVVLLARPNNSALVWEVPLGNKWQSQPAPGAHNDVAEQIRSLPGARDLGMTLRTTYGGSPPPPPPPGAFSRPINQALARASDAWKPDAAGPKSIDRLSQPVGITPKAQFRSYGMGQPLNAFSQVSARSPSPDISSPELARLSARGFHAPPVSRPVLREMSLSEYGGKKVKLTMPDHRLAAHLPTTRTRPAMDQASFNGPQARSFSSPPLNELNKPLAMQGRGFKAQPDGFNASPALPRSANLLKPDFSSPPTPRGNPGLVVRNIPGATKPNTTDAAGLSVRAPASTTATGLPKYKGSSHAPAPLNPFTLPKLDRPFYSPPPVTRFETPRFDAPRFQMPRFETPKYTPPPAFQRR